MGWGVYDETSSRAQVDGASKMAELSREERLKLVQLLTDCPLSVVGHEGYAKAEVTSGGIALGEVDPRTMQSRRAPGLYFCGEILDALGPIGRSQFRLGLRRGASGGNGPGRMNSGEVQEPVFAGLVGHVADHTWSSGATAWAGIAGERDSLLAPVWASENCSS